MVPASLRGIAVSALFAAASLATAGSLQADAVCVTGEACNANWQPFQTPIQHATGPGPTGPVYFDGWSWDGPNENAAYFIEGQGAFQGNPLSPGAQLPYWGNPDGSAVTSFYFQSGGQSQEATLLLASAQWAPWNSLGWYDPNSDAWGWIFQSNGTDPVIPQSATFTPTADFGLFFVPDSSIFNPAMSYYTDSTLNGIAEADVLYAAQNGITLGPETGQHFAVFDNLNGGAYVAIKDRSFQVGDNDYNDMILELQPVPEPSFFPLTAAVLAAVLAGRRLVVRALRRV